MLPPPSPFLFFPPNLIFTQCNALLQVAGLAKSGGMEFKFTQEHRSTMGQRRVQSAPTMETWTLLRWYETVKQELNSAVIW
jgi:hypothetical protein